MGDRGAAVIVGFAKNGTEDDSSSSAISPWQKLIVISMVYWFLAFLHQIIHNVPLVGMFQGLTFALCQKQDIPVKPMTVVLVFATSHNFLTPFGCTQNMISNAMANHTVMECFHSGLSLQLLQGLGTILAVWVWCLGHDFLPTSFL